MDFPYGEQMKAILYTTKYGATREYAEWLSAAAKIPSIDIKQDPDIARYDGLILGTPVFADHFRISKWMKTHWNTLKGKEIIIFSTGVKPNQGTIKEALPWVDKEISYHPLPGRVILEELRGIDWLIARIISIKDKSLVKDEVRQEHIKELIKAAKKL